MILLTAAAGGLGAVARFELDQILRQRFAQGGRLLMVINVSGSGLLGLLAGLATHLGSADVQLVVGAGFLGGYTTFSAASLATVSLLEQRRWVASLLSSAGMLLGSMTGAAVGLVIGLAW